MPKKRDFCVIGFPRSGTGYMSRLMMHYGYDVQHELKMGKHGVSSWLLSVGDAAPATHEVDPKDWEFKHTIFVVRHPFKTLLSATDAVKFRHSLILSVVGLDDEPWNTHTVARAMCRWYEGCTHVGASVRINVERAHVQLKTWLEHHGYSVTLTGKPPSTAYNSRKHRQLSMDDIKEEVGDAALIEELEHWCLRFGYAKLEPYG